MTYDTSTLRFQVINNQVIPDEGPKAMPLVLDFTTGAPIELDLTLMQQRAIMSMVQSIFIDASQSANDIAVTVGAGGGQTIIAKTKTQGYYTILAPNPAKLVFTSLNGGTDNVSVILLNVPVPGVVWDVS